MRAAPEGKLSVAEGRKTVAAAGTAEQLSTNAEYDVLEVTVQAETDNTGTVVVGGGGVVAALATRRGIALLAGDAYTLQVDQLTDVYLDVTVNGDGVTWLAHVAAA